MSVVGQGGQPPSVRSGGISRLMESVGSPSVWKSSLEALPPEAAPALVPLLDAFSSLFAPLAPPAAGAACLAVFDAGPGQLGGPRIAQIAVLLALARRAEAAGVRFAWGILQQPGAALSPGTGAEGLRQLLKARTPHEASGPEIAAWRTRLEERPDWDEVWVVGAPRLGSPPDFPRASHLQLWDALDPGVAAGSASRCSAASGAGEASPRPPRGRRLRAPAARRHPRHGRARARRHPLPVRRPRPRRAAPGRRARARRAPRARTAPAAGPPPARASAPLSTG